MQLCLLSVAIRLNN